MTRFFVFKMNAAILGRRLSMRYYEKNDFLPAARFAALFFLLVHQQKARRTTHAASQKSVGV